MINITAASVCSMACYIIGIQFTCTDKPKVLKRDSFYNIDTLF